MKILVNSKNEIISYALVGSLENGINVEQDTLSNDFFEAFEPKLFVYENGKVIYNDNYEMNEPSKNESDTPDEKDLIIATLSEQVLSQQSEIVAVQEDVANLMKMLVDNGGVPNV